ncbi:hypothetical protein BKA70DRAFT_574203 [Coprinopsis sp. MPI-PUGE-AT-0042]|nr:hypothetical protein BKA70DRAFT_574203 [Coprinopsis sp. MPI-PUGE-AT-0042]
MSAPYPHSIPTPPFSPETHHLQMSDSDPQNEPLKETVNLLDSLITYYQQESMWVCRTRATLENAFDESPFSDSSMSPPSGNDSPEGEDDAKHPMDQSGARPIPTGSQWIQRKRGFKMRLDLSPKARPPVRSLRSPSIQSSGGHAPPREHILTMFEKMMEARMESCMRVNKLVRNANRANLHKR